MVHRPGTRFSPNDLGAVRRYLRNMVERNEIGYLQMMDVYEKEPWLLNHVSTPLFKKNEWYYFVRRSKRGRIVKGRGDSEGGTWKSTSTKIDIMDGDKNVIGYKRNLVFNTKVNGMPERKTNWLMTEFTLKKNGGEFQDLVLVWIRYRKHSKGNLLGFNDAPRVEPEHVDQVPELEREHGDDLDNYINEIERMMLVEEDPLQEQQDNYANELKTLLVEQDQKLEQQNTWDLALPPNNDMMMLPPLPPSLQGQDFGFQTMMMESNANDFMMHENESNVWTQSNEDNVYMQNNMSDFPMQNNMNDFLMQRNESNDNNFMMQNYENFSVHNNSNNYLMQQSNENNFFTQQNETNAFMQNNNNDFMMQNNDNNFMKQNNGNPMMQRWNEEEEFRLDDFGFEGAEFVMLDLDELLPEPIPSEHNPDQEDQI